MPTDDAARDARAARRELDRLLEADAPALRGRLRTGLAGDLERFIAALLAANQRLNLTRITEPAGIGRLHLLDALAAVPLIEEQSPERALDVGSGGGVPAIPLALAMPEVSWTLVESVGKKADALRAFATDLRVERVTVVADRVEAVARLPAHRGAYDLVTARACAALPVLAEYSLPLLRPGGLLLAWKGAADAAELAAGRAATALLGGSEPEVRPTGIGALGDHRFVLIRKVGPTPDAYPRRPGLPARRPLG